MSISKELRHQVLSHIESSEKGGIEVFGIETRRKLKRMGYVIGEMHGETVASLRDKGYDLGLTWQDDALFMNRVHSRKSEFAINPDTLFLPGSFMLTKKQQRRFVNDQTNNLRQVRYLDKIIGAGGNVADWAEIDNWFHNTTGEYLLSRYEGCGIQTSTPGPVGGRLTIRRSRLITDGALLEISSDEAGVSTTGQPVILFPFLRG